MSAGIVSAQYAAGNTAVVITTYCPQHNDQDAITVPAEHWSAYSEGAHIQDAFPDLSAEQREQIITGICGSCFARIFSSDDDEN